MQKPGYPLGQCFFTRTVGCVATIALLASCGTQLEASPPSTGGNVAIQVPSALSDRGQEPALTEKNIKHRPTYSLKHEYWPGVDMPGFTHVHLNRPVNESEILPGTRVVYEQEFRSYDGALIKQLFYVDTFDYNGSLSRRDFYLFYPGEPWSMRDEYLHEGEIHLAIGTGPSPQPSLTPSPTPPPTPTPTPTPEPTVDLSGNGIFTPNGDQLNDWAEMDISVSRSLLPWELSLDGIGVIARSDSESDTNIEDKATSFALWNGAEKGRILPVGNYVARLTASGKMDLLNVRIDAIYAIPRLIAASKEKGVTDGGAGTGWIGRGSAGPFSWETLFAGPAGPIVGAAAAAANKAFQRPVLSFTQSNLAHEFDRHAADWGFGLIEKSQPALLKFANTLQAHVASTSTTLIKRGSFRGLEAVHFCDPVTRLNVITNTEGRLIGAWRLSVEQLKYLKTSGKLGGS